MRRKKLVANPPGAEMMHHSVSSCFTHGDYAGEGDCPRCAGEGAARDLADETRVSSAADDPLDWGGPNKPRESTFDPELGGIVSTVTRVGDPRGTWKRLEASLRVGEGRTERAHLVAALDEAETNCRLGHALWMMAKIEERRWLADNAVIFGAVRIAATRELHNEKDSKARSKNITDKDVEAMMAVMHPDEYRDHELRKARVEGLVESLGHLAKMLNERVQSLQVMLGKTR